ncbi:pilus assembly protein TadG-related protein [Vibrio parahaemolyticus]|uniref:pilus assembly protein TadG-related protein n=2 Tax=Vibrio parahaemolyticus TaxID=670 RepID=UPI002B1F8281|nr:pilus assembly protein TadG-related protein [Vibrio parahaemolyticus]MEA5298529.1 pilus assembly protein TadG-related protein [Vibrio parahaemolyticus]
MRRKMQTATRRTQKGITLVLISLVLLILLGVAAFGIDLNHQILNKTRLQNSVDAAALAAAVVADETSNVSEAETAAKTYLAGFSTSSGNSELTFTDENTSVTFSTDMESFVSAGAFTPPVSGEYDIYVRVAVSNLELGRFLSAIFGIDKQVSASAVAGRSAGINYTCNISPIAMCADTSSPETSWGYVPQPGYNPSVDRIASTLYQLKPADNQSSDIGPGNFHLLDLGVSGKNAVRDAFAGATNNCITIGGTVDTETGKGTGPVAQGINTRFGKFNGPTEEGGAVKSDKYVEEPSPLLESDTYQSSNFYYADYVSAIESCSSGGTCNSNYYDADGSSGRRILRVPIINCDSTTSGKQTVQVLGLGCFFLLQEVKQKGNESEIYGQFLEDCVINNGSTGTDPSDKGLYKIQLYKDPLSEAS